jgi:hypothetical protein
MAISTTSIDLATFLETLRSATEEQRAELAALLGVAAGGKVKVSKGAAAGGAGAVGRPKKAVDPRASAPLPEVEEDGDAPDAAAYRLPAEEIKEGVCQARTTPRGDKRWTVEILFEGQCGAEVVEDSDLCETCSRRAEAYAATPKPGKWCGRITEEPLPWMHMLGTAWATASASAGKLKWRGGDAADGSASVSSAEESTTSTKMTAAEARAAKEAEKAAAKAAKEAEKAAAKAAKEAEKAAAKAAKEAEKEAAKAAKEAAKAAKAAAPKAPKKAAAPKVTTESTAAGGGAAATVIPAKADSAATATSTDGEIKYIGGEMYWARGDKIYNYDMLAESVGEFVGRLMIDGETIDGDADEEDEE